MPYNNDDSELFSQMRRSTEALQKSMKPLLGDERFRRVLEEYQSLFADERVRQIVRDLQIQQQALQGQLSFLQGAAHALDLAATLNHSRPELPGWLEDMAALQGDWNRVGQYLAKALKDFAEQNERKAS
jgi:hypothetical protein